MPKSRIRTVTVIVFVASLALAGLLSWSGGETGGEDGIASPARVQVARVEAMRLRGEVRTGGFLRANADATISAERAGQVVALPVAEGDPVRAGDEIAVLDDTMVAAQLAEARAAEREASLDPMTPAAQLASARARLRQAEYEYRLRHPVAPHGGVVEVHHVEVGETVGPGSPLLDLVDASVLLLDVDVDAELVVHLEPGDAVAVEVPALGDDARRRSGVLRRVATRANPTSRRFRIEIELEPGPGGPRPGMYAEAKLEVPASAEALYLPKAFARSVRGQTGVYALREGRARWTPLAVEEVYPRPDLWRVVGGGLAAGDEVVASGFSGLRDGMTVEVER